MAGSARTGKQSFRGFVVNRGSRATERPGKKQASWVTKGCRMKADRTVSRHTGPLEVLPGKGGWRGDQWVPGSKLAMDVANR